MNELIPFGSAIAVAILTVIVGPLLSGELGSGLARRTLHHAELRSKLADQSTSARQIDVLLEAETKALSDRGINRIGRKLNGGNVAALVFVSLIGGALVFASATWALATSNNFGAAVLWALTILIGLFFVLLATAGLGTLYAPAKHKETRDREKAARKTA
jgi:hypothetical protein